MNSTCSNSGLADKAGVSYSPAITLALTRNCYNHCLYCGFRDPGAGLISQKAIEAKAASALSLGANEVLVMSGEKADQVPAIQKELFRRGFNSFASFTEHTCNYLLSCGLLPHINIGWLNKAHLDRLRNCAASMGLMLEGDYGPVTDHAQPQKTFNQRLQHLKWAGELKIPFTTGLLIGLGETREARQRSIAAIARVYRQYGHIQEFIVQPYTPNQGSALPVSELRLNDFKKIAEQVRGEMPGVRLQFPPNLVDNWAQLLSLGFNDLGGVGFDRDLVNPENRWPDHRTMAQSLAQNGFALKKRLPIYADFFQKGWFSDPVGEVIERTIRHDHGYKYYFARS